MNIYYDLETGPSANSVAKESNDLADLAKVLPESYQKSNEFSVNRECGQNVATDDRRTFTDKDKVRRIQTLGNFIALLDFISKVIQIFVFEICHSLARHEYLQGGHQQFSIIVFFFQYALSAVDIRH